MSATTLLLLILVPAVAGLLCLGAVRRLAPLSGPLLVAGSLASLVVAGLVFGSGLALSLPFGAFDMKLSFRLDALASFVVLSAAALSFLLAVYAARFMRGKPGEGPFNGFFLLTLAMFNGAVLADHLVTLLFFWEGMLLTLFAMIALGRPGSWRTAVKAFFIQGVTDLCLMFGIGLVLHLAGTLTISELRLSTEGLGGLAFVMLAIGALSKAGAMPFHSWIPDAATDAPLPFMALMPAALEKLSGIYLLARISLFVFAIGPGWASTTLMVVGVVTILLAVLMALVQKDLKRLLSFHAISQVGYMVLGIGTGVPAGVVGGLFHMVNHTMYKSTLFLAGGAVERQAGTTDLRKLGGLGALMPVTFGCFVIAALSISGVPPFNGFFSKELVYDAALERHWIFYAAAALGSFFTAASFLKLGHAAFKGPFRAPVAKVEEAPWSMLVPMIAIAAGCVLFGVYNPLPIEGLVVPAVGANYVQGHALSGLPHSWGLVAVSLVLLAGAVLNHLWGVRRSGSGLGAVDHIHHAPVLHQAYDLAERRLFDPYEIALKLIGAVAWMGWLVDRAIDWGYEKLVTGLARAVSSFVREAHGGSHATYLAWSVAGAVLLAVFLIGGY